MNKSIKLKNLKLQPLTMRFIFSCYHNYSFSSLSEHFLTSTNWITILRNSTLMLSIGIGLTFALNRSKS